MSIYKREWKFFQYYYGSKDFSEQYLKLLWDLFPLFNMGELLISFFKFSTGALVDNIFRVDLYYMTTEQNWGLKKGQLIK